MELRVEVGKASGVFSTLKTGCPMRTAEIDVHACAFKEFGLSDAR